MQNISEETIKVYGMVQGIGYRPFVKRLANAYDITGTVMNAGGIVIIHARGRKETLNNFVHSLVFNAPNGAVVDKVERKTIQNKVNNNSIKKEFMIISSEKDNSDIKPLIPVDLPTCEACEKELFDKKNKRYRYPFISCTSCGPRYSIINEIPYDRENITMNIFKMCKECEKEYTDVDNIRCHAQTIACHECGPKLYAYYGEKGRNNENILNNTEEILKIAKSIMIKGGIIAIKDIGGYHLVCVADNEKAVHKLRKVKDREQKPFAVMFKNMDNVKEYCDVSPKEENELKSVARPIVLLRKIKEFFGEVCANSYETGAMLPCNPLQIILLNDICGEKNIPLIMTSANRSGEPIITDDEAMKSWWSKETDIDMVIYNEREIVTPLDDSLIHVINGKTQIIRRARGFVPEPVELKVNSRILESTAIMAAGGDLKSAFCLYQNGRAYMSQYLGDIENDKIIKLYKNTFDRMSELCNINPKMLIVDKHPLYNSAKVADEILMKKNIKKVQHHFAHAASVVAEHGIDEDALAIVWDGTGYGEDGNVWGGEFILYNAENKNFKRIGHISEMNLIGGNEGAKNAQTILYGYASELDNKLENAFISSLNSDEQRKYKTVKAAINCKINTVKSTSAGRLFDCISSALSICKYNYYEGQCASELENAAYEYMQEVGHYEISEKEYSFVKKTNEEYIANTKEVFRNIMKDILYNGCETKEIALKFHYILSKIIVDFSETARRDNGINNIILSGGTFQNRILLAKCLESLEKKGFKVYINEKVPAGDGGIALGQVFIGLNE